VVLTVRSTSITASASFNSLAFLLLMIEMNSKVLVPALILALSFLTFLKLDWKLLISQPSF